MFSSKEIAYLAWRIHLAALDDANPLLAQDLRDVPPRWIRELENLLREEVK